MHIEVLCRLLHNQPAVKTVFVDALDHAINGESGSDDLPCDHVQLLTVDSHQISEDAMYFTTFAKAFPDLRELRINFVRKPIANCSHLGRPLKSLRVLRLHASAHACRAGGLQGFGV